MYPVLIRFRSGVVVTIWCEDFTSACFAAIWLFRPECMLHVMYSDSDASKVFTVD